jgi:hypothetical protein
MILLYILALKNGKKMKQDKWILDLPQYILVYSKKTIHPNSKYHGKEKTPKFTLHCVANLWFF